MEGGKWRALIVDDDEALQSVLEYKLSKSGFEAVSAGDGAAALELLRQQPFDAVLLDIMMPRLDGFQLLRALESGEVRPFPLVFVLSARTSEEDILRALQLGATDYITKPFSLNVLVAKLHRALVAAEHGAAHGWSYDRPLQGVGDG